MGISLPHDSAILLWAYTQRTLYSTTRTIAHINWDFILNIHKLETTKITLKRSKNKEIVIRWNNQTQMKFPNNGKGRSWLPISYHQIKFSILGVSYIQLSFWQRSPKEISKYLTVAKKKGWYSQTHSHTKKSSCWRQYSHNSLNMERWAGVSMELLSLSSCLFGAGRYSTDYETRNTNLVSCLQAM